MQDEEDILYEVADEPDQYYISKKKKKKKKRRTRQPKKKNIICVYRGQRARMLQTNGTPW